MTTEITWTGTPDDMTAISGEYMLRVYMHTDDEGIFLWDVYYENEAFECGFMGVVFGIEEGTELAKSAAINAMKEHLKKK